MDKRLVDTHNRIIDYLRISVTDRCNLRCIYCMPEAGVKLQPVSEIMTYEELIKFATIAVKAGIRKIRLTGGEPLVRKNIVELVRGLSAIEGLQDISLTTNGILLEKYAGELFAAGLKRVNISLDSLDPDIYKHLTRGGDVRDVIKGMKAAIAAGLEPVKINVVVNRDVRPELDQIIKLIRDNPVHVRFIERMPFNYKDGEPLLTCPEIMEAVMDVVKIEAVEGPKGFGPANYFEPLGSMGTVGFICPNSRHICSSCNRLRLTSDGKMRTCLFSDDEIDVKTAMRSGANEEEILMIIRRALDEKPKERKDNRSGPKRRMNEIGG